MLDAKTIAEIHDDAVECARDFGDESDCPYEEGTEEYDIWLNAFYDEQDYIDEEEFEEESEEEDEPL